SVVIESDEGTVRLTEREIRCVEVFLHYIVVRTDAGDYRMKESLGDFAGRLSADFFRIHRSVLVNLRRIVKITRTDVTLDSGDVLPIARGKYDAVNRAFIERVT
ncbi:MAG: LytTR family transcriptional regulator, partial [Oscillospiraceae bacterium]|nr:LytTR family transcriptional regulator [Oscillospiraceae bacterium]